MSKYNLNARLVNKDCGYTSDQEQVKPYALGTIFEVEDVHMGQSHTSVHLSGEKGSFNSIHFQFVDDEGLPVNIFKDPRFNPYIPRN